jgi:signal transduction histidine kinase
MNTAIPPGQKDAALDAGDSPGSDDLAAGTVQTAGAETAGADKTPDIELLFDALAAMDVAVVLYDAEDRVRMVSPLYISMFPEEEPVMAPGTPYADTLRFFAEANDRVSALGFATMDAYLDAEVKRHRTPFVRQTYQRIDGRWVEARKIPLPDGGIAGLWRDITTEKTAELHLSQAKEAAERSDEAKSAFLTLMSHELRTPLNAIIGFAEILGRPAHTLDDDTRLEYGGLIADGGRQLLRIINDILDLTRIGSGERALAATVLDLSEAFDPMVQQVVRAVAPALEAKNIRLDVSLTPSDGDTPLRLAAEAPALRRMIRHLLENAIAASEHGGTVSLAAGLAADGRIRITVSDEGPGLSNQDLARAMEPFAHADESAAEILSREGRGLGLGLPLVKAMAELHGGDFVLSSHPGEPTRACILLPPAPDQGSGPDSAPDSARDSANI